MRYLSSFHHLMRLDASTSPLWATGAVIRASTPLSFRPRLPQMRY